MVRVRLCARGRKSLLQLFCSPVTSPDASSASAKNVRMAWHGMICRGRGFSERQGFKVFFCGFFFRISQRVFMLSQRLSGFLGILCIQGLGRSFALRALNGSFRVSKAFRREGFQALLRLWVWVFWFRVFSGSRVISR